MAPLSRRTALLVGALPVPLGTIPLPTPCGVPAIAAEFHRARAALPGLERARRRASRRLTEAETEYHSAQDTASDLVTSLETAPLGTLADAEALRGVALVLVKEGRDPARHDMLAAAEAAVAEFSRSPDP